MITTARFAPTPTFPTLLSLAALLAVALPSVSPARAQDASATLTMTKSGFQPSTVNVKAGVKVKLTVHNAQSDAAEFESAELNREKVIPPGGSATVYVGPLEPGSYGFFDEFHPSSTGRIVAK
jgi:plastocyanin